MASLARTVVVAAACAALGAALPAAAAADTCPGPPAANIGSVAIPDNSSMTSTIVVAGAQPYLARVDVITAIRHTFPGDVDVTLTSPGGTTVTITTDNGSGNDDVFNGTRFSDAADPGDPANPGRVNGHTYANKAPVPALTPEEPLSNFVGEDPNGVWTLTVADDQAKDLGTLDGWSLDLRTLPGPPGAAGTVTTAKAATLAIPDNDPAGAVSTIDVAGAQPHLRGLVVETSLKHTASGDLDVTLRSPAGTVATLVTDKAGANDNVFDGTLWRDDADLLDPVNTALVGDRTSFSNNVLASPLVAQEPLGAFLGENPNGTWTLTAVDDTALELGSIASWRLSVKAHAPVACAAAPGGPPPAGGPGTGGPGPGPAGSARLSGLKLTPKAFRAAAKGASVAPARGGKAAAGAIVSFSLSAPATVRFAVERKAVGRRADGRCAKPTKGNRERPACTRWTPAGSFSALGRAGANAPRFSGRVGGKKLAPGAYRLSAKVGGRGAGAAFTILP